MEVGSDIKLGQSTENHKSIPRKKVMKVLSNGKYRNVISFDWKSHIKDPGETKPYKSGIEDILQLIYNWSNKNHSDYHRLNCVYVHRLYIYTYIFTQYNLPPDLIKLYLFVVNI